MRTDALHNDDISYFFRLLIPQNALILETCLQTGLRISDVLRIQSADFKPRMSVRQAKTGKTKRVYFSKKLFLRLDAQKGSIWLFPGRDPVKPKTRQAVWADMKRASKALRIDYNAAPHSARKSYAVDVYKRSGGGLKGLEATKQLLQHDYLSTTLVYLASVIF